MGTLFIIIVKLCTFVVAPPCGLGQADQPHWIAKTPRLLSE